MLINILFTVTLTLLSIVCFVFLIVAILEFNRFMKQDIRHPEVNNNEVNKNED